jgi:hypothetical protein
MRNKYSASYESASVSSTSSSSVSASASSSAPTPARSHGHASPPPLHQQIIPSPSRVRPGTSPPTPSPASGKFNSVEPLPRPAPPTTARLYCHPPFAATSAPVLRCVELFNFKFEFDLTFECEFGQHVFASSASAHGDPIRETVATADVRTPVSP